MVTNNNYCERIDTFFKKLYSYCFVKKSAINTHIVNTPSYRAISDDSDTDSNSVTSSDEDYFFVSQHHQDDTESSSEDNY